MLMRSSRPPSRNGGLLLRGAEVKEGRREGKERKGKGIPQSRGEQNKR